MQYGMKRLICQLRSPVRVVRGVILTADTLFLLSLLPLGMLWWMVDETWHAGSRTIHLHWHDRMLWWPAGFLLIHGAVAYGAREIGRASLLGLFRHKAVSRFILLYMACAVPLVAADRILRWTHVDIRIAPMVLQGRQQGTEHYHKTLLRDPELLWKFEPGSQVHGRTINRLGFREREVDARKGEGVRRVICLGDSVTAQGQPGYAQYLHEMLTNAPPDGGKWEAFSMGVYGYASLQGLRLLQLRGKELQPDIVTVSFGRNDHNLAETPDRLRMAIRVSSFMKRLSNILSRRILGRMALHFMDRQHVWTAGKNDAGLRVPPDDFRQNMRAFVAEIRALGATPILLTAPRRKIPKSYVTAGYARSSDEFGRQHDEYAQIVRDVAQETGATLLDLQRIMSGPECDGYFASDHVHFDFYDREGDVECGSREQPGLRCIARELYATIQGLSTNQSPSVAAHAAFR